MDCPIEHREARFSSELNTYWPERVAELAAEWVDADAARRNVLVGKIWELLNAALLRYLRVFRHRLDYGEYEDLRDIASQKALDLISKLDAGVWRPQSVSSGELCSFIATVARNGLIDHLRVVGKKRRASLTSTDTMAAEVAYARTGSPEDSLKGENFVEALEECLQTMSPKARAAWFLRVMLGLPSKEIARHPVVRMSAGAVDVLLSRARGQIRKSMGERGFSTHRIPVGVASKLWIAFEKDLQQLLGDNAE